MNDPRPNGEDLTITALYDKARAEYGDGAAFKIMQFYNRAPGSMVVSLAWKWAVDRWMDAEVAEILGSEE